MGCPEGAGRVRLKVSRVPHVSPTLARRITLAWIGIALWLGGVELMPNLHLAMHARLEAHVHDGDRTIYLHHHSDDIFVEHGADDDLDAEVDEHGNVVPEEMAHPSRAGHDNIERADHALSHAEHELALRLEHGGHALAHHALALHPAPPPALAPLPFHRYLTVAPHVAIIEPGSWSVPEAAARGPPLLFV